MNLATQQQITAAAFALCPHLCALKGCDHLHCTPDRSTIEAAKAALAAAEAIGSDGLFALMPVDDGWWPSDWENQFRRAYPRNVGMAAAIRKLDAIRKKRKIRFDVILAGVDRYAESVAESDMKFIANPVTWVNAERWGDDVRSLDRSESSGKSGFAAIARADGSRSRHFKNKDWLQERREAPSCEADGERS